MTRRIYSGRQNGSPGVAPSILTSLTIPESGIISSFANAIASNVSETVPALVIILALAVMRLGRDRPPLLKWDEMAKAVDWNIVMLFGGGLVLGQGM